MMYSLGARFSQGAVTRRAFQFLSSRHRRWGSQGTRDYLMAVKNQIKVVKADHKQKARDTKSTQLLRDKLKNAAGF